MTEEFLSKKNPARPSYSMDPSRSAPSSFRDNRLSQVKPSCIYGIKIRAFHPVEEKLPFRRESTPPHFLQGPPAFFPGSTLTHLFFPLELMSGFGPVFLGDDPYLILITRS